MGKRYAKEVKEEVLRKVREGQRVSEVARSHGINEMTIRSWLERDTGMTAAETLGGEPAAGERPVGLDRFDRV